MNAGVLIKNARKAKDLTQKQLGELAGIAEPTIRRYELGKLNPKYETLQRIAAALGVPVDSLIDDPNRFDVEDIKDAIIYGGPIGRVAENMQQLNLVGRQRVEAYSVDMLKIAEYRYQCPQEPSTAPPEPFKGKDTTSPAEASQEPPEGRE
ncbi:MAG: helix-turn-helix transcriptional regulator [Dysosmobacter sp.]|nr:helix-turn-helix transcriptional regulator [Dysosmobacter sp.]